MNPTRENSENTRSFAVDLRCVGDEVRRRWALGRPITCRFAVRLGGDWFPHQEWDDFILAILCEWIKTAFVERQDDWNGMELHFMDGPFLLRFEDERQDRATVRAIERRKMGEEVRAVVVSPKAVVYSEILNAARRASSELGRLGGSDADLLRLNRLIAVAADVQEPGRSPLHGEDQRNAD